MASKRWKALERTAAEKLKGRRITEHWTLFRERPDVVVPDFRLVCDCKAYERFSHHTMLETVKEKYCGPGDIPVLVSKSARQTGECITIPLDFFATLLDTLRSKGGTP